MEESSRDLLAACLVFRPTLAAADVDVTEGTLPKVPLEQLTIDAIVLSQSCDLVQHKVQDVLLCACWQPRELPDGLGSVRGLDGIRRGHLASHHLLPPCSLEGFVESVRVVDFRSVYTLPLDYFRRLAAKRGKRLRLLPPYREHLSQAFARYFMRVGLPADIPQVS